MDISRFRRIVKVSGLSFRQHYGLLSVITAALIAVISRIVDRDGQGNWVLWRKSYLPDGYNYILEAIRITPFGSKQVMLEKLHDIFPDYSQITVSQSSQIISVLQARPLYPFLTSLFVNINFEIAPLIFPVLSWFVLHILIYFHIRQRHGAPYAVLIVIVFSSSFYMRLNFIGTTTDAISALLCYLVFYYIISSNTTIRYTFFTYLFMLLAILTRPLDPIFLVLIIGLALLNLKNTSLLRRLLVGLMLLLTHLIYIQLKYQQLEIGTINTGGSVSGSYLSYLSEAFIRVPKLIIVELAFVVVNDPLLMLLLFWSWIILFLTRNKVLLSQYFLVFLATFYLASLNGTIGSGFRYQLPIVMFSLIVISAENSPAVAWKCTRKHISHNK